MEEPILNDKKESSYLPSPVLTKYLNETFLLLNIREKLRPQGKEPSIRQKRRIEQKYKDKITVLNKHVFQSMASLVYFFEFLNSHPKFAEQFEEDVKELLLGSNESGERHDPVFLRLVRETVTWNYKKDPDNFRLMLLFFMQEVIAARIAGFATQDFNEEVIDSVIRPDFNRSSAWVKLYARRGFILGEDEEDKKDYDRPVLF
jgi:hypothetical protein